MTVKWAATMPEPTPGSFDVVEPSTGFHMRTAGDVYTIRQMVYMVTKCNQELAKRDARIAELEAAQQWRPMSEAPVTGVPVLLGGMWMPTGWECVVASFGMGSWGIQFEPTHWLPLPSQPVKVTP